MRNLTLDMDQLLVDSFTVNPEPAPGEDVVALMATTWQNQTSGPCLDSMQTCEAKCIA
jgi:hypothetical protein